MNRAKNHGHRGVKQSLPRARTKRGAKSVLSRCGFLARILHLLRHWDPQGQDQRLNVLCNPLRGFFI
jgi:hypothetical protein